MRVLIIGGVAAGAKTAAMVDRVEKTVEALILDTGRPGGDCRRYSAE